MNHDMKKNRLHFPILILCLTFLLSGCDSWLDHGPEENLTIEETFLQRNYAQLWLYNLYSGMPMEMDFHNTYGYYNIFTGACDEIHITPGYAYCHFFNHAQISSTADVYIWRDYGQYSRKINLFLANIGSTPMEDEERQEWIGEAHFLRAFYHFLAFRLYGPIPILDKIYKVDDEFMETERATYDECVDFIVKDCDEAIRRLPVKRDVAYTGRATSAAAAALKSRVLLYAASPLYNGNPDYEQMKNAAGVPLIPTEYDPGKWKRAAAAAKACIDLCSNDYALYYSADRDPVTSCMELFYENWNKEVLFAYNVGQNPVFEGCCDPISFTGYSIYGPTQQMVDTYRMSDGTDPFETDADGDVVYSDSGQPQVVSGSSYREDGFTEMPGKYWPSGVSNMYVGREPRFYAQVNFNGQLWKGHNFQLWYTGVDGKKVGGTYYTATGYVMKKMGSPYARAQGSSPVIPNRQWIFFRLAEIYLNYAEALNEAEPGHPDILTFLNRIRERGGIPPLSGTYTQAEMRKLIRQERHVELSFETHRFFDVRRWKIAMKTCNAKIYGMDINAGTHLQDPAFYERTLVEQQTFPARMYLYPINQSERNKCPSLVQNLGY